MYPKQNLDIDDILFNFTETIEPITENRDM
jgi:hypothetical protein